MSYDIDLISPADSEDRYNVGNYTSNVSGMWHHAFYASESDYNDLLELQGLAGEVAGPHIAEAVAHMLLNPHHYEGMTPTNNWGSYEGAMEYLLKLWRACREYPKHTIQIDC